MATRSKTWKRPDNIIRMLGNTYAEGRVPWNKGLTGTPARPQENLVGKRFGKLLVIASMGKNGAGRLIWLCKCDCGNERTVQSNNLKSGNTKSCRCTYTGSVVGQKRPSITGEKNHKWIEDRSLVKVEDKKHQDPRYKQWKKEIHVRDKGKCRIGNADCSGRLEAHHILPWSKHPELRYEVKNGISLCHYHHPRTRKDEQKFAPTFQQMVLSPVYELALIR